MKKEIKSNEDLISEAAEKYAIETQEKLNKHLGIEVVSAWGPLSGAYVAGAHFMEFLTFLTSVEKKYLNQEISQPLIKREDILKTENQVLLNQVLSLLKEQSELKAENAQLEKENALWTKTIAAGNKRFEKLENKMTQQQKKLKRILTKKKSEKQ
jgi:hypothetical protein